MLFLSKIMPNLLKSCHIPLNYQKPYSDWVKGVARERFLIQLDNGLNPDFYRGELKDPFPHNWSDSWKL